MSQLQKKILIFASLLVISLAGVISVSYWNTGRAENRQGGSSQRSSPFPVSATREAAAEKLLASGQTFSGVELARTMLDDGPVVAPSDEQRLREQFVSAVQRYHADGLAGFIKWKEENHLLAPGESTSLRLKMEFMRAAELFAKSKVDFEKLQVQYVRKAGQHYYSAYSDSAEGVARYRSQNPLASGDLSLSDKSVDVAIVSAPIRYGDSSLSNAKAPGSVSFSFAKRAPDDDWLLIHVQLTGTKEKLITWLPPI